MMVGRALAGLLLGVSALAPQAPAPIDANVKAILLRDLKFSAGELADLQKGKIPRHAVGTNVPGEVAVVGAVRVHAPKSAFFDRLRDIERFKRDDDVVQIGRFSIPPKPSDLDALTVDRNDFDVTHCKVGDCGIRLPADLINRLNTAVDRNAPDAQARGARLFKQILFEDVSAYWSGTNRMAQYDDGDRPIRPLDAFQGLLKGVPSLGVLVPGLPAHLADFPRSRLEGAEDFLYWSKEKFGIAPFITATHITIVCRPAPTCVATSKDVYSSRYFDASLALTIASDDPTSQGASFYLVYVNRSRADALKGGLAGLRRSIVERRARGSLEESLKRIKLQLEKGL
jgi:hypothetical protein